ncbi:hypothetical protein FPE01S_03_03200 [Flavihumibacter petaseus NBRC 106054]|uniref:Uncharacterized protein n=1 Tax=Flavihumibacter petaseus NBRC 106054 TaxID=1220578 RepID=A0A0E9N2P8_9BACT|nr:hypothetical protein FPE01S_03_03200 [Flavihumibacter petaseus NBRC 106054]
MATLQGLRAQQTAIFTDPKQGFKLAKEFYQHEEYSLAYPIFKELYAQLRPVDRTSHALDYAEIRYYTLVCGLRENEKGVLEEANEFVALDDNQSRVELMSFYLGEYYFRHQNYYEAVRYYEKTSVEHLSNEEVASLKFHQGYSYFNLQRFEQAKPLLDAVRQTKGSADYAAANYYYGFIAFRDKQYREALNAFKEVENDPVYRDVVPYYIATIYYITGDKDKALQYAETNQKKGSGYYQLELQRLIGHAWFEKGDAAKALPYLENYASKSKTPQRQDLYELAHSYYQTGNYTKAIAGFKQLSGKEDSLAQNAMYLLGDAYLKTGQKANARNAFLFCSINSSNPAQQEVSKFNYGKLSYELGFTDIALTELQQYLEKYPNGANQAEARELLIGVMARTSNYKDALVLLDGIKNPSEQAKQFFPAILYGRATELVNDGRLPEADALLDRTIKASYNQQVLPLAYFWKGEIAFRSNRFDDAIRYYSEYLAAPKVNSEVNPAHAHYNLGYAYLKKEQYQQAMGEFEKVAGKPTPRTGSVEQDAYARVADCYYMQRNYPKAGFYYDQIILNAWPASDYAGFQKAMIAGISKPAEKIRLLQQLQKQYGQSSLIPDANMEIANTYLADEKFREALPFLNAIVRDPGSGGYKPKAYLSAGIAYFNLDNNAEALKQFNELLQLYPHSPEADEALDNARAIYLEEGKSSEYVAFSKKMGRDISSAQQDSLAYAEAELQLSNGNFNNALQRYDAYLSKYPEGRYAVEANYYKAEIYMSRKDWTNAAAGYEAVAARVPNKFGEKSLLQAARLNFFDLKNYDKSAELYSRLKEFSTTEENKLEAMRGLLRSQYQLNKWADATPNAKELMDAKGAGVDDKLLANMVLARAAQDAGQYDLAISYFKAAAGTSKGEMSAEARYGIAWCLFQQGKFKEAEKSAFEVVNKNGSYELWVTRSYLLLGDIYMKQGDLFNAKATYQSVLENSDIAEIKEEAQRKLNEVSTAEKQQAGTKN